MRLTTKCNVGATMPSVCAGGNAVPTVYGINYATHTMADTVSLGEARRDKRATKQKVIDNTPNRHMQSEREIYRHNERGRSGKYPTSTYPIKKKYRK